MKGLIVLFLLLISHILLGQNVYAQEIGFPFIRNYSPKEYKAGSQVFSVVQAQNGVIYFAATNMGIVSYDGINWDYIHTPNQSSPYCLVEDKEGRIYTSSFDDFGYLTEDKRGKTIYQSLKNSIPDSTWKIGAVWDIQMTSKKIYFASDKALFEYDVITETIHIIKHEKNFNRGFVYNDDYYTMLLGKGIMRVENGELVDIPNGEKIAKVIWSFKENIPYSKDSMLIVTEDRGLFKYTLNDTLSKAPLDSLLYIDNNTLTSACKIQDFYAIGSRKGVLLIDKNGKTLQSYNKNNNLQSNSLSQIITDRNQNMWLGLMAGLSKTEHSQDLSYWSFVNGLDGSAYRICRFKDRIYITTSQNVYYIAKDNSIQPVKNIKIGQNWDLKEVIFEGESKLMLGSNAGLYEIKDDTAFNLSRGTHALSIVPSKDTPNRLFTTQNLRDVIVIDYYPETKKWNLVGSLEGISDMIIEIIEDDKGGLWLTTFSNGIIRVTLDKKNITKPKEIKFYKSPKELPFTTYTPFKYKGKIIWATEKGLYIYNYQTDNFDPFCDFGEQFCDGTIKTSFLQFTPKGRIYITYTNNENSDIGYLDPQGDGTYKWVYKAFRRLPSLSEINSIFVEGDNVFWIASSDGLIRYDEAKDTKNYDQDFNCLIRKVAVGDSIIYLGGGNIKDFEPTSAYPHNFNNIKFQFAAPFFDQEEKTVYSYMLSGFDTEWSPWTREGKKEYTNLSKGIYTFKVKAKNIYDKESTISSFTIQILPPIYLSWWAYLLYILGGMLLTYTIIKLYTRRLEQQKNNLEKIVQERTIEISQQKEEIQQQSETLKIANVEISQQKEEMETIVNNLQTANDEITHKNKQMTDSIKYALTIQQAILPSHKYLKQHLDYFICYHPKDIVSGDFYWFTQLEYNHEIYNFIALVDCTGHGVPGGFMSMVGNSLLNEIIKEKQIMSPALILEKLDKRVKLALQQNEKSNDDGMDVALLRIKKLDADNIELCYAGAKRPLILINEEGTRNIKGTNKSIGGIRKKQRTFQEHIFEVKPNTCIYMFTDGFTDQSNKQNKKYGSTKLTNFFENHFNDTIEKQGVLLNAELHSYKETSTQKDDITVMGVRL